MAEQLGRFALLNRIGSGGMAEVFLARGPAGMCVVKRMHARLVEDEDLVRMFLDEASLAAQLSHPGIARVFELGKDQGNIFFAMEYVPGFDLYTILQEHAARKMLMAPEVAGRIAADLASALHHAHEAVGTRGQKLGIIHRDVSPQNVLISTQGQVKLIDFGVARAAQKMHQTRAGLVKGKAAYMAPEQVVGAPIDRRVDIYALGLVMFEMLTNHRAIVGEQEMEIILNARAGKLNELTEFRHDVPEGLRRVMMRCLSFKADSRPTTADQVRLEVEQWLAEASRPVGRAQLSALLGVVPADPTHAIDKAQAGPSGKMKKLSEASTLKPRGAPLEKPGDETFRSSRRVSSGDLMREFNEDGTRQVPTDVERKSLAAGPVPQSEGQDAPTLFVSAGKGKSSGPPTLRNTEAELIAQIEAASRAGARTERNSPVTSKPSEFDEAPRGTDPEAAPMGSADPNAPTDAVAPEEADGPEHITEKPEPPQPVSDLTVLPRRSKAPVVALVAVLAAAALGAVAWLFRGG